MAFGTSAPEILLSMIEIFSSGFYAGDLGPGTIVGSAAYNLLIITAVCIMAIDAGKRPREAPIASCRIRMILALWLAFCTTALLTL